jgi:hypothetical protein
VLRSYAWGHDQRKLKTNALTYPILMTYLYRRLHRLLRAFEQ